ncbi:MAG: flavodoxin [Acidaminococcaceae bacterium]|nr:flavodoxin [Acidaminococcaceae bacterium]
MSKILVAYFSKTGITAKAAAQIAKITGGELFEIKTEKKYPSSYWATVAAAKIEHFKKELPILQNKVENMDKYDTVFLGFPIWWFTCPNAVYSFLDAYDFEGKTILPFCTHGGSGPLHTAKDIRERCPEALVKETFDFSKNSTSSLEDFCKNG